MMKWKAVCAVSLVAAALVGCTANVSGTVTPGVGASAAPNGSNGTGATIGGTGSGATVEVDADLAAMYKLGRKWVYSMATTGPANMTQEMTWEVVKVENGVATLKTTITGGPAGTTTSESPVSLAKGTKPEAMFTGEYQQDGPVSTAAEAVTVAAGSYPNAQKVSFKGKLKETGASGASASMNNDVTFWWDKLDGLVKEVVLTKMSASAPTSYQLNQIPSLPGMPAGVTLPSGGVMPISGGAVGVNLDTTTTIELKSVTR